MPEAEPTAEPLKFDLATLTLGEAAAAELASGMSIAQMAKSGTAVLLLAMFVLELRNSAEPRSWSVLSNLPLRDASSSISPSRSNGRLAKSSV